MVNKSELLDLIKEIHIDCHKICQTSLGKFLEISGNIGIFSQSQEQYDELTILREQLTYPSENPNQKYYLLIEPIIIPADEDTPEAIYTHLYIRKPDPTPYGKYLGDIDFILPQKEYDSLKSSVINKEVKGAELYDRPGWDTIQITHSGGNAVAYVSTKEFAEKVRVKFD